MNAGDVEMIVTREKLNFKANNGKWKTAYMQLKSRVGDYFDWHKKEVMVILLELDENPTAEDFKAKFDEYKKMEEVFNDGQV